jgi:hypothetical protein
MTRALLLLSVLSGGCLVVPAKKTFSKPIPNEAGAATFATQSSIALTARFADDMIHVHAIRHGECSRPVFKVTEVTTERKAKLGGADDPRAMIFGAVLAPITIPISAIVTGLMLAGDEPVITQEKQLLGTQRYACSQDGSNLAVQMTLPSGATVEGLTDARGDAELGVPATEPYTGAVDVAAQGAEAARVAYALPRPAISVARDAVIECAGRHQISGSVELKASINGNGHVTRLWLSLGDATFNACVSQRLAGLRFPAKTWDHTIRLPVTIAAPAAARL